MYVANKSIFAVWVSLISNVLLTILKIVTGLIFNSKVLVADGIHNAGDVVATIAALTSALVSRKPADEDHPYGHGKAEAIASGIVAIILIMAALLMVYKSVESFFEPPAAASWISLVAALISLIWKQALYMYCIRIGRAENSRSLIATAYDHIADVYASAAAFVGIGISLIGDHFHLAYTEYGDSAAGIIVSYLVIRLGFKMGREAIDILMDKNITNEQLAELSSIIYSVPNVKRVDSIRARELGNAIIVDVKVSVPNQLTVKEGHDVSREVKKTIMQRMKLVGDVMVHLNPWYEDGEQEQ
ncbi:cation diffusion facilitator family transporter [Paenibacillus dokdonensis]|uniref:Cation diffusion facilitator family transporter n=1 Tax=Paenibacillus dokdonensis TaxID=2567944 RepID=A0ABU6GGW3_9BACL|nr:MULTISPECIES: cation diffusion facilitator family transporter [Paenibacillus]MEC0238985.1 cation diffusion facilitator family transporter [Paenibacillus dokdonensis]